MPWDDLVEILEAINGMPWWAYPCPRFCGISYYVGAIFKNKWNESRVSKPRPKFLPEDMDTARDRLHELPAVNEILKTEVPVGMNVYNSLMMEKYEWLHENYFCAQIGTGFYTEQYGRSVEVRIMWAPDEDGIEHYIEFNNGVSTVEIKSRSGINEVSILAFHERITAKIPSTVAWADGELFDARKTAARMLIANYIRRAALVIKIAKFILWLWEDRAKRAEQRRIALANQGIIEDDPMA